MILEYSLTLRLMLKKTLGICYGNVNPGNLRPIYLNNVVIKWHSVVKYLGNMLSQDLSDAADIKLKKRVFHCRC